jgi:flagellar hook-associated protein 1 FlgK
MATLWTTPSTTTAGTLEQAVIGLSTGLGANAQAAQQLATATSGQVTTTTSNLQTVAGVDTDQQAVILTNYSQAYQAAAQAISAAHTMFESLLQSV